MYKYLRLQLQSQGLDVFGRITEPRMHRARRPYKELSLTETIYKLDAGKSYGGSLNKRSLNVLGSINFHIHEIQFR